MLVGPVWREPRDVRLTPRGRDKAQQHGASAAAIAASLDSCTLCGACEPACPEALPLVDMVLELRRQRPLTEVTFAAKSPPAVTARRMLLPGRVLGTDEARRRRTLALLGAGWALAEDDGADIALALEAGGAVPGAPRRALLGPLPAAGALGGREGGLSRAP